MDNLTEYRLANAKEKLESAKLLLDAGKYKDSIGRSYYAIFTSLRAVLSKDGVDFSKHAGVIAYFQREYIKTGIFDRSIQSMCSQHFKSVTVVIMMISLLLPGKMQRNSIRKRKNCMQRRRQMRESAMSPT